MSLSVGQVVEDRYLLEEQIGQGGMSRVFRAVNRRTGKHVALKELYVPANDQAETLRGWFRREIKALMVLDHPNVLQLIDHGETAEGSPYVVTELLEGADFEDAVTRFGPLPEAAIVEVARQTLSAFAKAHAMSIVHRDIKPGNLFASTSGRVVVLDFGLARAVSPEVSSTLAQGFGTQILGTPQYWSPEQIKGVTLDPRSDIYSLGGTLYFLASKCPPYPGSTPFEIAGQIMMGKRKPLLEVAPKLDKALAAFIEKMLTDNADNRPTAGQLEHELVGLFSKYPNHELALREFAMGQPASPREAKPTERAAIKPPVRNSEEPKNEATVVTQVGHGQDVHTPTMISPPPRQAETTVGPAPQQAPRAEPARPQSDSTSIITIPTSGQQHTSIVTVSATQPSHTTDIATNPGTRPASRKARGKSPLPLVFGVMGVLVLAAATAILLRAAPKPPIATPAIVDEPLVPPAPTGQATKPPPVGTVVAGSELPAPSATEVPKVPRLPAVEEDTKKPVAVAQPTGPGTLNCQLKQWAEVIVDGKSFGKQQIGAKLTLEPGKHDVSFRNPKFGERTASYVIKSGRETPCKNDFEAQ